MSKAGPFRSTMELIARREDGDSADETLIESITLEHKGWDRDFEVAKPRDE